MKTKLFITCLFLFSLKIEASFLNIDLSDSTKTTDSLKIFRWNDGCCFYESFYNPKDYSETQLENTLYLFYKFSNLKTTSTVFNPSKLNLLNLETLEEEYISKKDILDTLNIVNVEYWNEFKKQKFQELKETYELKRITIEGYKNPNILLTKKYSETCFNFAQILNDKDSTKVIEAWKKFSYERFVKNKSASKIDDFNNKYYSNFRYEYAKIELMSLGWWNCANHQVLHLKVTGELFEEFEKLFIKTNKLDCNCD